MSATPKRPVIAVAGSAGKTTTKEMIASILQTRWRIFKSKANHNNRYATRCHLKQIRSWHRAVVLEFGMSGPGHLRQHCQMIRPDIAIITNVGSAHIGNFRHGLSGLIRAKSELIRHMKQTGILVLNADDPNSRQLKTSSFRGRLLRIGQLNHADYRGRNCAFTDRGMTFTANLGGNQHNFFIPVFGFHNVYNALFAMAVADRLGFTPAEIKHGLASFHCPPGRLRIYRLKNGMRVIDDTFNANPHAVRAALQVLPHLGGNPNILVMGSMLEMGRHALKGHREVGRYVARNSKVDYLFTYGGLASHIRQEAVKAGFPAECAIHTRERNDLHRRLDRVARPGAAILVKGSNGMHMYRTVAFLQIKYKKAD